ncbi:hypothetical protein F7725_006728 [Dissostichus mawsoni]|uniref:VWFC domain-containing protein n=1 Tax=Dissostichus mawsoni TaxID=36200 RepID=A0A7J5XUP9_DISMA|nr:hypothetical protein F7725_006728 [Dissostichus mawsoni]
MELILLIFGTQVLGWYALSKTRHTAQETAGIPIWSPLDSCTACATGHVKCKTIKCPALPCEHPVAEPQQCCPRCTGRRPLMILSDLSFRVLLVTLRPAVLCGVSSSDEPRTPAGLRASVKSCRYNGSVYQPGETFTKLDLFPSKQSNQCVVCTCSNGNIFCGLKTCQPITCSSAVSVPDTCCLVCKDTGTSGSSSTEEGNQQLNRGVRHSVDQCSGEPGRVRFDRATPPRVRAAPRGFAKLNLKGASETTVKILLQREHQRACSYNGKTYSHGDMWHPVLGKVLECILCTCTDGVQDCKRITCPSQYPCQHPMKSAGKCCKTCPERKTERNQTQCYTGHKSNVLVYKVDSSMKVDPPDTVRIIAVEKQSTAEVEVQVWKTVEETWKKFKEEGEHLSTAPQTTICEDGIREMVTFLNPKQTEGVCSP